jgi:hypothetical protein
MIFVVEEVVDSKEGYTTNITYKELGDFTNSKTQPSKEDNYTEELQKTTSIKGTVNTTSTNVTFTNVRKLDTNTNTGLNIDFLPYALVLIVAVCGSILFIIAKKRKQ